MIYDLTIVGGGPAGVAAGAGAGSAAITAIGVMPIAIEMKVAKLRRAIPEFI